MTSRREIDRREGRGLFGLDPVGYDQARPPYPDEVFALLEDRCHLGPGSRVFEVGPGTGLATRRLAELGPASILAIEPDPRFRPVLESMAAETGAAIEVRVQAFEQADLPAQSFDLGVAATSFHWVAAAPGLAKAAAALRPGGWWAMWWNVFGDPTRPDPFHDATHHILEPLAPSPSQGEKPGTPYALDFEARQAELEAVPGFCAIEAHEWRRTVVLGAAQVRALYATFSSIARLEEPERLRVLDAVADVAASRFKGRVERLIVTALYLAKRR